VPVRVRPSAPSNNKEVFLMLTEYFPVLVFLGIALGIGVVLLGLGALVSPYNPDSEKLSTYECGFEPFDDSRIPFDVRFYLVALLFIIFDLETAFLFPWAVVVHKISWFGFFTMFLFIFELVIAYAYLWRKGALEWE